MGSRRFAVALVAGCLLATGACGSKTKVGDRSLLNFKDKSEQELGATTTTTAPPAAQAGSKAAVAVTAPPSTQRVSATPTTSRPTATTARPAASVSISINSDNAASAFDPSQVTAKVGTTVTWVNHDTVPRSVAADDGKSFSSPPIPPGGSWSYAASRAGTFNYHDGTRPYAVASLEIVAA